MCQGDVERGEAICLCVEKHLGEQVLSLIKKLGCLHKDYLVHRVGEDVCIPIDERCINSIEQRLPHLGIAYRLTFCSPPRSKSIRRGVNLRTLLKEVLPCEVVERIPRSFDVVGDIALIELDPDIAHRYGHIVAEAIMRLQPRVRAVFARGATEGVERVRRLIHIGGENRTQTIHREHGILIAVDIAKAYFNPSLSTEHARVASYVDDHDLVLDLFAGVGPFALHIATRCRAYVVACDINVYALQLLRKSIELNRRRIKGFIEPIAIDSIEAIKSYVFRENTFTHIIMNLPHEAPKLSHYVLRIVSRGGLLHIYGIASSPRDFVSSLEVVRSFRDSIEIVEVVRVLDYAPRKYIFRATLRRVR